MNRSFTHSCKSPVGTLMKRVSKDSPPMLLALWRLSNQGQELKSP